MSELSFYCEIAAEARSMLWSFWFVPIAPLLSLCLIVWNLSLPLKSNYKKENLDKRYRLCLYFAEYVSVIFLAGFFGKKVFWSNITTKSRIMAQDLI